MAALPLAKPCDEMLTEGVDATVTGGVPVTVRKEAEDTGFEPAA